MSYHVCARVGKPLRLPVSDVFKNKAGALVAAGKVEAGALRAGTKVLVVPGQAAGSIRAIEVGGQVGACAQGFLVCLVGNAARRESEAITLRA